MFNPFQRALMGLPGNPFGIIDEEQQKQPAPGGGAAPQSATTADVAAPMLDQDRQTVAFDKLGQMGAILMAAGQRMTPYQRAQMLSQGANVMGNTGQQMYNAAQARLMGTKALEAKAEQERNDALRQRFSDPNFLQSLGINSDVAAALGPEGIKKLLENQALANTPDNVLDRRYKEAQIKHLENPQRVPLSPQLVDLPGGGKAWSVPGSGDVTPIAGAGKGGVDPELAKRTEAEDKNLTYAKEAIAANRILSAPQYSGQLTSGYNKKLNMIPTLEGSWAGEDYLTGDRSANSFIDSVVRPRSGAVVGKEELENNRKIFTPSPGDSQDELFRKAKMRAGHIQSLIAGANPADRAGLQKLYEESVAELQKIADGYKTNGNQGAGQPGAKLPVGVRSIKRL